jgi:hypothetical protein
MDVQIVQRAVARLPWRQIIALLETEAELASEETLSCNDKGEA